MVNCVKWLNIITLVVLYISISNGQTQCRDFKLTSNKGRTFLLTFPESMGIRSDTYKIYVTSSGDGHLNLTQHSTRATSSTSHYDIHAGVVQIDINAASLIQTTPGIQTKVVVIDTDTDVAVFLTAYIGGATASYIALPVNLFSTEYVVSSFEPRESRPNQNIVTALYNETVVNITDTNGTTTSLTLGSLESYNDQRYVDVSGTVTRSNKPVSVITGNKCTSIPLHTVSCDTLLDSPIPVMFWGTKFIVSPLKPRSGYLVRIYTHADNQYVICKVMNSTHTITKLFTGMYEISLGSEATFITANDSVNVVQYGLSQSYDKFDGDPFMMSAPAVSHYSNDYVFPSPLTEGGFVNRLVITMDKQYAGGLRLDGDSLNGTWTDLTHFPSPYDTYSTITVDIGPGNHTLLHPSKDVRFSAILYGLKQANAFGFSLGFTFSSPDDYTCYNGGTCGQDRTCACTTGYTGKHCEIAIEYEPTSVCFSCEDAIGLSYCDSIEYCQQDEICFVQRSATNVGHVTFRSGCINKQICAVHEQDSSGFPTSPCTHCCHGYLCNSAGCDDPGLPSRPARGPLCLECSHIGNARDCLEITLCSIDEQCSIEEFTWGEQRNFHLGCRNKHQCAFGSRSLSERSVPVCQQCCEDDICNTNCTATPGVVIIG